MNADGFLLLKRLEESDPIERQKLIEQIDRVAYFARTKKHIELIEYSKMLNRDKAVDTTITMQLVARLLENLT